MCDHTLGKKWPGEGKRGCTNDCGSDSGGFTCSCPLWPKVELSVTWEIGPHRPPTMWREAELCGKVGSPDEMDQTKLGSREGGDSVVTWSLACVFTHAPRRDESSLSAPPCR